MDKRTARRQVIEAANAIIEQRERQARGWDVGAWRADMRPVERNAGNTIRAQVRGHVEAALIAAPFAI